MATQELCRLQRLAQQTFFGTPEAAARVEWAMPVGKPHCSLASHLTRLQPSAPLRTPATLTTPLPPAASRRHLLLSPSCRRCPQAYANTPLPPAVAAALRPPDGLGCTWSRGPAPPRGSPHACGRPPAPEARPIAQGDLPAPRAAPSPCRVPAGVGGISEEPHLRWCRHPQV